MFEKMKEAPCLHCPMREKCEESEEVCLAEFDELDEDEWSVISAIFTAFNENRLDPDCLRQLQAMSHAGEMLYLTDHSEATRERVMTDLRNFVDNYERSDEETPWRNGLMGVCLVCEYEDYNEDGCPIASGCKHEGGCAYGFDTDPEKIRRWHEIQYEAFKVPHRKKADVAMTLRDALRELRGIDENEMSIDDIMDENDRVMRYVHAREVA